MTWHDAMPIEVSAMFYGLSGGSPWTRSEEAAWVATRIDGFARWSEHGQWWRRTIPGKRLMATYQRSRVARLKSVVVAVKGCAACGKPFEVTAHRRERRRDRVCGTSCRAALRKNIRRVRIGCESMPLAHWCRRYGVVSTQTAWSRMQKGWTAERAVKTPPLNRGQRRCRPPGGSFR